MPLPRVLPCASQTSAAEPSLSDRCRRRRVGSGHVQQIVAGVWGYWPCTCRAPGPSRLVLAPAPPRPSNSGAVLGDLLRPPAHPSDGAELLPRDRREAPLRAMEYARHRPPPVQPKGGVPRPPGRAHRTGRCLFGREGRPQPCVVCVLFSGIAISNCGAGAGVTSTAGLGERGNDTSKSTGRSGRQSAATRRNMRREERVTVQGPVKKQQPDGMSRRGCCMKAGRVPCRTTAGVQCHVSCMTRLLVVLS